MKWSDYIIQSILPLLSSPHFMKRGKTTIFMKKWRPRITDRYMKDVQQNHEITISAVQPSIILTLLRKYTGSRRGKVNGIYVRLSF